MSEANKKISSFARNIIIMSIVGVCGALAALPFAFFDFHLPGISLGILLGTLIEIICYILLVKGCKHITANSTTRGILLSVAFNMLRLALYVAGLIVGAFATFKWSGHWINVFAVAGAYMPVVIILIVTKLKESKDPKEVQ